MNDYLLLNGKVIAAKNQEYCLNIINEKSLSPHLYVFLIGNNPPSEYYVNSIKKQSLKYNIRVTVSQTPSEDMTEDQLIDSIERLNNDPDVHGIMVQKPLPKHYNVNRIEQKISPYKDVDGFHALNAGLLM